MTAILSPPDTGPGTGTPSIVTSVGPTPAPTVRGGPPALLIDNVTKRFVVGRKKKPVIAINRVSMRLERGEIQGILGANGSGKSTLIRLVSGLLTLDEGRVEVFGLDLVDAGDGRSSG